MTYDPNDHEDGTTQTETDVLEANGFKHYPYTSEFVNAEDTEVCITLHIRKPQRQHILRIAKAGKDKSMDTQKEVLVELTAQDERENARKTFEQYPLVSASFADEVFKSAGMGSVRKGM